MGMFILEALIALALLIFIVWWTLGPVHRREQNQAKAADVASTDHPQIKP